MRSKRTEEEKEGEMEKEKTEEQQKEGRRRVERGGEGKGGKLKEDGMAIWGLREKKQEKE